MPNYKKSIENQKVAPKDIWETRLHPPEPEIDLFVIFGYALVIAMLIGFLTLLLRGCFREPMPQVTSRVECHECHHFKPTAIKPKSTNQKLVNYFKSKGSKHPKEMADALNGRRHKRVLAAISVIETGADPTKRNSGFKRKHHGAFQVNPEYHGKVPYTAKGQAIQAERILIELTREMPLQKALNHYGGDSTNEYQRKVMAELRGVPK